MKVSNKFDKKMTAIRNDLLQLTKEVTVWNQKHDRQVKKEKAVFQKRFKINRRKFDSLVKLAKKTKNPKGNNRGKKS